MSNLNKRGLSNIIATILIILLSIASISLLYSYFKESSELALSPKFSCLDYQLNSPIKEFSSCYNSASKEVEISLKREVSEREINSMKFSLNGDKVLNFECLNSCGCLIPQSGEKRKYFIKEDSYQDKKTLSMYVNGCLISSIDVVECRI